MNVFIVEGAYAYRSLFKDRAGFKICEDLLSADLVLFTGGQDVDPSLYGHSTHPKSIISPDRDAAEEAIWLKAKERNLPCVGICRGAQLLNVLNGGTLYQDVDNHSLFCGHKLKDLKTGKELLVTSTHHQMMRPNYGFAEIVATAKESTCREIHFNGVCLDDLNGCQATGHAHPDFEVVWYEFNGDLCFQPHPEYGGYAQCTEYFFELIDRYYSSRS